MKANIQKLQNKFLFLGLLTLTFSTPAAAQSTVSLSTYYPAPFGAYDRLRLVPRNPSGIVCNSSSLGTIFTTDDPASSTDRVKLQICGNSGPTAVPTWENVNVWTQSGNNVFPTDFANANLNVGIGTNSPRERLNIKGSNSAGSPTPRIEIEGLVPSLELYDSTGGNASSFRLNVSGGKLNFQRDSNSNGEFSATTTPMTITDQGYVGMGTVTPLAPLHIARPTNTPEGMYGNLMIFNGPNSGFSGFKGEVAYDGGNDGKFSFANYFNGSGATLGTSGGTFFKWVPSAPAPEQTILALKNSGNVGVGTADPQGVLHLYRPASVAHPTWFGNLTFFPDNANDEISFDGGNDGIFSIGNISNLNNARTDFNSNTGSIMTLTNTQRVGIGTTNPDSALQINQSSATATGAGLHIYRNPASATSTPNPSWYYGNFWLFPDNDANYGDIKYDGAADGRFSITNISPGGGTTFSSVQLGRDLLELKNDTITGGPTPTLNTDRRVIAYRLEVSNEMKLIPLASTPVACNASNNGVLFVKKSSPGALCFCDGASWTKAAGAGTCP